MKVIAPPQAKTRKTTEAREIDSGCARFSIRETLNDQISEIFSVKDIIPSAGQGVISLQCNKNDDEIVSLLKKINLTDYFKSVGDSHPFTNSNGNTSTLNISFVDDSIPMNEDTKLPLLLN